jgi:DNA-directed RNA polymerase specialized sigma subunit
MEYVKNKELYEELLKSKENDNKVSEKLGKYFYLIAKNLSNKSNFTGYTWKDEMISEAVFTCVKYFKNFNPEKSTNAFAYITQICYNAFIIYIKKQKKHSDIKQILYDKKNIINDNESKYTYSSIDYTVFKKNKDT